MLNLSSCILGSVTALEQLMAGNITLLHLDLSQNSLGMFTSSVSLALFVSVHESLLSVALYHFMMLWDAIFVGEAGGRRLAGAIAANASLISLRAEQNGFNATTAALIVGAVKVSYQYLINITMKRGC
jgi:hypothetical protein